MSWCGRSNTCPYLKFFGSGCLQIGGLSFVEKPLGGFSIRVQGYGPSAGRHLIRKPSQKLWLLEREICGSSCEDVRVVQLTVTGGQAWLMSDA
jgi:hypothetical protein